MAATGADERCAVITRTLGEPMAGTAPVAMRWLGLEEHSGWPRDLSRHPDPAVLEFTTRATAAGFRLVLVRRPGPVRTGSGVRLLLTDTRPAAARTTTLAVAHPSELAAVVLPEPGDALPGIPVPGALLLVCTHTERDPCCGADGRALVDALVAAGEPDVWECSHLGGHRFAPTALVLPTGYFYGNLDPATAAAARAAAAAGEVATDRCRGRSTWSPTGQVAELAVRAAAGLRGADLLTVYADATDTVQVSAPTGARWAVDVTPVEVDAARPASCGARPTLMAPLQAGPVRPLPTTP